MKEAQTSINFGFLNFSSAGVEAADYRSDRLRNQRQSKFRPPVGVLCDRSPGFGPPGFDLTYISSCTVPAL